MTTEQSTQTAKHTPGPWKIGYEAFNVTAETEKGTMKICDIRGWGHLTGKGQALGLDPETAKKIQEANAALIAAAPGTAAERDALIAEKAALLSNNQALHSRLETECAELDNLNEAQANKIVELKALNEELAALLVRATDTLESFNCMENAPCIKEFRAAITKHKAGGK